MIDTYKSLIWTDRYNEYGDFEIECLPTQHIIDICQLGRYIWSDKSEKTMIIENVSITTDISTGSSLKISGKSLESLLMRRIIWKKTILDGKVDSQIRKIIEEAFIHPEDPNRKIENFIYEDSKDPSVDALKIKKQFTGTNLYEAVKLVCDRLRIGFKLLLNDKNQLIFSIYNGEDRSYEQIDNPYVVFSNQNGNLTNSNNVQSTENWMTIALVAGEDEGEERKTVVVGDKTITGIDRRELFVDARDLQSETSDGEKIPEKEYEENLINRGTDKLEEYKSENLFEGEAESLPGYEFNIDYNIGDICELETEFGMNDRVRVIEMIYSENGSEVKYYPTFRSISEEEKSIPEWDDEES